jgi:hypothetical protein
MKLSKIIVLVTVVIYFLVTRATHCYAVEKNDTNAQLIVSYRKGESPDDLRWLVQKRQVASSQSYLKKTTYAVQDMALRLVQTISPEQKLNRLLQTDELAGVVSRTPLAVHENLLEKPYLVKVSSICSVEHAIALYEMLPEVAYVEENILYAEMN